MSAWTQFVFALQPITLSRFPSPPCHGRFSPFYPYSRPRHAHFLLRRFDTAPQTPYHLPRLLRLLDLYSLPLTLYRSPRPN
jgi:hypothetical protein